MPFKERIRLLVCSLWSPGSTVTEVIERVKIKLSLIRPFNLGCADSCRCAVFKPGLVELALSHNQRR